LAAVQANFYFLVPNGEVSIPQQTAILPFDYASVKVIYKNVSFSFTRGRGEANVSVSPRHAPAELYELGRVISALDDKHLSACDLVDDFPAAASLLRPRLEALNDAFSKEKYLRFKEILLTL
jgi:hypothetical protein